MDRLESSKSSKLNLDEEGSQVAILDAKFFPALIGRVTFHWEVKFRDRNLLMDESQLYSVLLPVVHNGITLQVHNPARRGEKRGEKSAISSQFA